MVAVDISYAQTTNIDFVAMRAAVDTVIMKAGGSNSGRYVDSKYRWFEPRARAAGHRIGHYWFNGTGDPVTDADFFVNNLSNYRSNDLLALDIESEGSMPYASPAWALAFVNRVKQRTGRNCDVYMSSSVTRAQNWAAVRDAGSKLWVAQYGTNSGVPQGSPNIAIWPTYKLWQYSSNGSVPGYAARLDVNIVNETQWDSSGNVTPITEEQDYFMPKNYNAGGTIFTLGETWGKIWTSTSDFSYLTNMQAWGAPVAVNMTGDQITTAVNEANARGAAYAQSAPAITDAQITALANQIAAQLDVTELTEQQIKDAVTASVTPIINGAVVNLAQNNADQTATIKNFTFKAQ